MTTPFIHNPQRDAWKAIKGFSYQIELTILRWLNLEMDTILICECGEDIDHVKQILDANPDVQERLLEQIKTKEGITLKSLDTLTALARFREAVVNNPSLRILYRFSTTATPAKEQGVQFLNNLTGIGAWNAVREGNLPQQEVLEFVEVLRTFISRASCPQGLQESVFTQLQQYVASTDPQLLIDEFIRRFEWVTGLPDPPQLRAEIQTLLLTQSRAHTEEEAQLFVDILTTHVLHSLSQKGEKRLTVEALEGLLQERSITELDRRLLTRLTGFIEQAAAYLPHLSSQMEFVSREVAALEGMRQQLNRFSQHFSRSDVQILSTPLPPPDEPPLPPF